MAVEQGNTKLVFQRMDSCRDIRLNGVQFIRGRGDASQAGDGFEYPEISALHFTFPTEQKL